MIGRFLALLLLLTVCIAGCGPVASRAPSVPLPEPDPDPWLVEEYIPEDQRVWFRNPDGSCVQCSIAMNGVHVNNARCENLLWDVDLNGNGRIDPEEKRVRGGSGPSRVRNYCNQRGIQAYNVTGDTQPWIEWAMRTGRTCAITFNVCHMIYACDMLEDGQRFRTCDNNSPRRIDEYSRREFIRRHRMDGAWVVVLKDPPPPPTPAYVPWWE